MCSCPVENEAVHRYVQGPSEGWRLVQSGKRRRTVYPRQHPRAPWRKCDVTHWRRGKRA